jgi:putative transposase
MLTFRSYRTELAPTRHQRVLLARHCGAARFAYNWGLARRIQAYERDGTVLTSIDLHRELNQLKRTDFPWLYEVSKCAPHEALRDLDQAFSLFFRGLKSRRRVGFPKFKKRKQGRASFRLNGVIRVFDRHIQLPRLGRVRLKEEGYLPTAGVHLLSATVVEEGGRWFVALRVREEIVIPKNGGPTVGADFGLVNLVTTSDGDVFPNVRPRRRHERRIRRLSRSVARRQKGSANRRKAARLLSRLHARIANARKDHLHKVSTSLAKTKSVIVIEDLSVRAMQRSHRLGSSLPGAGFGELRTLLEYKAEWYGSVLHVASRFYPSSQRCSECGWINSTLPMSARTFVCPSCGHCCDRDLNAARNLRSLVAASSAETQNACGAGSAGRGHSVELPVWNQEPDSDLGIGKVIGVSMT